MQTAADYACHPYSCLFSEKPRIMNRMDHESATTDQTAPEPGQGDRTRPLSRELAALLSGLRWRIRAYVWVEGLALAAIWMGLTFWVGLAIDYLPVRIGASEMPRTARAVLLAVIAAVLAYILYRWVLRRAFAKLAGRSMAVLLERRFPGFHDSLLTAVELGQRGPELSEPSRAMLSHTDGLALQQVDEVRFRRVFNFLPLLRNLTFALVMFASIVLFGLTAKEAFGTWVSRLYLLSNRPWPRRTHIEVVGFQDKTLKAAQGSSLTVQVRADASRAVPVPEVCTIHYATEDGERGRTNMTKTGSARNGYQVYSFSEKPFKGLLSNIRFDVVGGDHRLRDYEVQVVPRPSIIGVQLTAQRPAYTELLPVTKPWSPGVRIEMGSQVTLRADANKDLRRVTIVDPQTQAAEQLQLADNSGQPVRSFVYDVEKLDGDMVLDITLEDTDAIVSQRPHRITIDVIEDQPPEVDVVLRGIGTAITVNARIPVFGTVRDDHGIDRTWFDLTDGEGTARQFPCRVGEAGKVEDSLDLRVLRSANENPPPLREGERIALLISATDRCDLHGDPNLGQGDLYELDVVSPSNLLARLEARELGLRRNFERMIGEMKDMRDSLARVQDEPDSGTEPGEENDPIDMEQSSSPGQRRLALRQLRVQRAIQYCQRTAQEIAGVAASFDDICLELINNRVNSQEREERIKQQIYAPLQVIAEQMFPDWEQKLDVLQSELVAPDSEAAAETALQQADRIVVAMEDVLAKMLEVEDFNELVDMVRSLIREQEAIIERTKKERKKQLLGPLGTEF